MNRQFPTALYKVIGNKLLIGLYDLFWNSTKGMVVSYTPSNKTKAKTILEEHRMILKQIKKRDPEKAADYMFKHFRALSLNKNESKER